MAFLPRRFLQGFVALLALALSALGGPRLSPDRIGGDTDEQVVVRRADAHLAPADERLAATPVVAVVARGDSPEPLPASAAVASACPTPRLGSALGPRAP